MQHLKQLYSTKISMNKILTICCALMLSLFSAHAQSALVLQSPDVAIEYQITALSPDGKWACGNINDGYTRAFRWNLTSGEFRELSLQGYNSMALSISNDGTVVGTFMDDQYFSNGGTIEAAGYYKDGKWHHLDSSSFDAPTDDVAGSQGQAISPNGKLIGGIALVNGSYAPIVWNIETNKMEVYTFNNPEATSSSQSAGSILAIADNGVACGWLYRSKPSKSGSGLTTNRTPAIWLTPNDTICPSWDNFGPYCYANSISSDGTKVLAYNCVYDITTGSSTSVISFDDYLSYLLFDVNNNGTVAGYGQVDMDSSSDAILIKDGQTYKVADYLTEAGADLSKYPYLMQLVGISDDEKTFLLMAYDASYTPRAIAVKLDQNITTPAPTSLKAVALNGIGAVQLTWKAPLTNAANVKSYDLYRDGTKIASTTSDVLTYVDQDLVNGTYQYIVKAIYDGAESEPSTETTVTLAPLDINEPRDFVAVQRGLNNVRLMWNVPEPTLPSYTYAESESTIYSIGGGSYSMEVAIKLPKDLLAAYAAKDTKLSAVCFYPMSLQSQWKVNLYTADTDTTLVYSQTVDGTTLTTGIQNTVHLTTPYAFTADKDLLVAVEADVDNSSYSLFGFNWGICTPQATDLMRQVGESVFYSAYDRMQADEDGSMMYELTWAIKPMFSDDATAQMAEVKNYKLYVNDQLTAQPTTTDYVLNGVADGKYTYAVAAVTSNDTESAQAVTELTVLQDRTVYEPKNVRVVTNNQHMTATWKAPADDNRTILTYSSDNCNGGTVGTFMAKTTYGRSMTRTLDGYQIKAFRFYPLCDADFTFYLEQDGKRIAEVPVDNYTINQWNEVELDEPITLSSASDYALILDSYDVVENGAPLGRDNQYAVQGVSDLYSTDDGETFSSLVNAGGEQGNWMMGLTLGTAEATHFNIEGYNIRIDGAKVNNELLSETTYEQTFSDSKTSTHRFQVQAVYGEPISKNYNSDLVYFIINVSSGIVDATASEVIHVAQGTTHLQVSGVSVKQLALYAASGARTAQSSINSLGISNLPHGVYVLVVTTTDGKEYSQKVQL